MSYNPFTLEGKTILVTGASSGIGRATAIECSKLGAKVIITARNMERLHETFCALEGEGHSQIIADISQEDEIKRLVNELPILDGVVSNAGVGGNPAPVQFYTLKEINRIYAANAISPMLLVKHLIKGKRLNCSSSVVFTSSIGGVYCPNLGNGIYETSKSALHAYMRVAALELGRRGIRVNSVNPGMVNTPLIHGGDVTEEQLEEDKKNYVLGRYGLPQDIAYGIIYLLSDASSWVTGTALKIDGGRNI